MGMGTPACFDSQRDLQSSSSLGIDCHNATLASVPAEMRVALQSSRGSHNEKFHAAGKVPAKINKTVQEAYALGTIQGARAIGMEDQIGSLAVGKLADIVVFDALSPALICGGQYDPVTAIVMHSTPGDIVMTIVDGIVRKRNGRLEPVPVTPEARVWTEASSTVSGGEGSLSLKWSDVVKPLLKSRANLQNKMDKIDFVAAKRGAMKAFGMDESSIVESL